MTPQDLPPFDPSLNLFSDTLSRAPFPTKRRSLCHWLRRPPNANATRDALELGARMMRTGFDFRRIGERGLLVRTFQS